MKTIRHHISILSIILTVMVLTFNAGQASDEFPIATTAGREMSRSAAFDGTNYLVGIQGDQNAPNNITAQLVSQSGALVGSRISVGRTGGAPDVAFDGTNYLMVWRQDDGTGGSGQLVSTSGATIGSPFQISGSTTHEVSGIAYGGGSYLATYFKEDPTTGEWKVYGRIISPNGAVGPEIAISIGYGYKGFHNVAFDGTNFLVVWTDDANHYEVKGRLVSPAGALGTEFTINASTYPSDNPLTVAFGGTNYLVVWNDEVGGFESGEWDLFGQIVTPSGSLSGGVINISVAPGDQILPSIAFDGTNYLVAWTEGFGSTEATVKGRFFDKSGGPVGSEFTLFSPSGGRVPWLASTLFDGSRYFSVVNRGTPGTDPYDVDTYTNQDVYGAFTNITIHGEWTTKTSMPAARSSAAVGVIDGILYVAGGFNGTQTSTLWAYNPTTDTWVTLASMPDGRYQGDGAGVINGQLYVAGGWDNTYSWLPHRELFVYDPANNSWSSKANMPILSACGASGVINGKLYVTTACDGYSGARNFLHVYDPATDTWSSLAPSPNAHGYPASGVINNKFYVAGGVDDSGVFQAKLDVYDPATNTWTTKASMPVAGGGFASEVINDKLYVVGGYNGASVYYNTLYIYDPSTDTWTTETSMPTARAFAGAGVINGVLYVVGGTNSTGTVLATVEAFVPVTTCTGPSIASHPQSQTIQSGQTATLSVSASGTAPLSYQWYQGISGDTSNPISGATSSSYTTPALTQTTSYWVRVSNSCGSADSNTATITVTVCTAPTITTQPQSQTIQSGQTATLSVSASGTAPLSYQWYQGSSGDTSNPISGATSSSYTTPAWTQTTSYWVRLSNSCGSVNSNTATITVGIIPSCPSLYVWNGNDYETRGFIFPGALYPANKYVDNISLNQLVPKRGPYYSLEYSLQIRETEPENSFIDMAKLIVVDHGSEVSISDFFMKRDSISAPHTQTSEIWYNNNIALASLKQSVNFMELYPTGALKVKSPISAGSVSTVEDVTYQVFSSDGQYVSLGMGDMIVLTFPYLPQVQGEIRDFIFVVEGFYVPLPPPPEHNKELCSNWARTAVAQNEENLRRACGFTDPQWNSDYNNHFQFCLSVPWEYAISRENAREYDLRRCRGY